MAYQHQHIKTGANLHRKPKRPKNSPKKARRRAARRASRKRR